MCVCVASHVHIGQNFPGSTAYTHIHVYVHVVPLWWIMSHLLPLSSGMSTSNPYTGFDTIAKFYIHVHTCMHACKEEIHVETLETLVQIKNK